MKHTLRICTFVILLAFIMGALPAQFAQAETINFGWAQSIGGEGWEYASSMSFDDSGNVYITGFMQESGFPPETIIINKLDGNGNILWSKSIGGPSNDAARDSAVSNDGSLYVIGSYSDTVDFDTGAGTSNLTSAGSTDVFLSKFDSDGNLLWAKSMGGTLQDSGDAIMLDDDGNLYITGYYSDTVDFDPGTGTSNLTSAGSTDVFLSKFDSDGNLLWAKSMGGASDERSFDIAIGENGNVFLTGYFSGTADFDPGEGTNTLASIGQGDVFICNLDSSGNFVWTQRAGTPYQDGGIELALDGIGNIYAVGYFSNYDGSTDIFVGKTDGNGNWIWTKTMGGASYDAGHSITLDSNSDVFITGDFFGTVDFDPSEGISNLTSAGGADIFLDKLDSNGNFIWAKNLGGAGDDLGENIMEGSSGDLYLSGSYTDTVDFDPGPGTHNLTSAGNWDIFVSRFTVTPQIYYVKCDATGANNGSSWTDAYIDLQSALAAASSGDEIWVAKCVYKPGTNRTDTFQLKDGVAVYGGFDGLYLGDRDPIANPTILSGDIDNNDDSNNADGNFIDETYIDIVGSNSYHVVTGASGATLDGFIITAGYALSYPSVPRGGGMYNYNSSPALTNVIFIGNSSDLHGGGLGNYNSSPTLTDVAFTGNEAAYGGGMSNDNSSPTIMNATFSGNEASYGGGMDNRNNSSPTVMNVTFINNGANRGGGMSNTDSNPMVTNVDFSSNTANTYGGGMYNQNGSSPTVTNVTFSSNSADSGGGMYNYQSGSDPIITNVTFRDNSAIQVGGGMYNSSSPTVTNVTFSGNQAQRGGGMYNYYSNSATTVMNVTFSGNSATNSGGGMYNFQSNPIVTNVTFSGNSATSSGGGMYSNSSSSPTLRNVIIANSTGGDCALASSTLNAASSNNLLEDTAANACNLTDGANGNIIGSDPLLGTLGNYGGSTQTLRLLPGSLAVDAGTDSVSICDGDAGDNFDQRGVTRPQGTHCDIGAYEVQIGSFRSRASGPWNDPATWEISTNGGITWSSTLDYPSTTSGTVQIQNSHTVTVTSNIAVDEVSIDAGGQVTVYNGITFSIANGAGSDLAISGSLLNQGTISLSSGAAWTVAAGGTYIHNTTSGIATPLSAATLDAASNFIYRGSSTLTPAVSIANRTYGNLFFESTSGTLSLSASGINPLTVQGNLSIGATGAGAVSYSISGYTGPISIYKDFQIGTGSALTTSSNDTSIGGTWSNNGAFTPGAGTVLFNGTSLQTIGGSASTSFNNLTLNNSNGILLGANITVNNVLTFTSGKITTGTNVLTIGPSGSVSGAGDGKYVYGFLRKTVGTGNPSLTFEVGGASNYAPVNVTFNNVSAGGTLTGSTTDGKHPNFDGADPAGSGLDGSNYINRYWTLTQSGLAFTSYDATFNFIAGDYVGSPSPGAMIVRKYDSPNWSHAATNTATATSATGTGFTSFSDFAVGNDTSSTPVTLSFFAATREGSSTTFTWSTATESGNLGFHLYAEENGRLQRLNAEMIPSQKVDSLEQLDYSYRTRTMARIFYIEEVDIHGRTGLHGPFGLGETYGERVNESRVTWATVRKESRQKFNEQQKEVRQDMKIPAAALQDVVETSPTASKLQLQNTVYLKVNKTGIYRVTYEMLKAAGLDLAGVPASKITVTNRGEVVPIYVETRALNRAPKFGPGDYFEFYGEALDTLYTDTNVYVVQVKKSAASRIVNIPAASRKTNKVPVSFQDTLVMNNQKAYANYAPGNDPWYDREMLVFTTPKSWNISFDVTGLTPGTAAVLDLTVWGVTDWPQSNDHHMQVSVNDSRFADETFDGLVEQRLHLELPAGLLHEGANTLTITLPGDTGVEAELITFDQLSVTYQRAFTAQAGRLTFSASDKVYKVMNLPTKNVVVYRQDARGIVRLRSVKVSASGNTFTAMFAGTGQPATYFVSVVESLYAPVLEASRQVVDLNQSAQYLIIAHPNFIPGLQPLIRARQAQGLTVSVVNVNDLYTQYSYGIFDPAAIQKYIAYAVKNLGTQYVLLVGGDTYDYRNYLGVNSVSFIPSLYTSTSEIANFVPSDPLYADVNTDRVPDVAIGRFPVRTIPELDMLVAKTLAYASKDYGRTAVFASDRNDGTISFQAINNQLASTLPDDWSVTNIHLDTLSVKDARLELIAAMNAGQALVTFTGHSDPQSWTFSNLFTLNDTKNLTNAGRPFIVVQWGCWNNYYVDPVHNYLVQGFLFNGDRGAAATLGATTLANADSEQLLGELLTPRLATPGMTLGEALQDAKVELAQTHPEFLDVILGWSLMGDPALTISP